MKLHCTVAMFLIMTLLLAGCDMIEYHPYDTRLHGATGLTRQMTAEIEQRCNGKDTIRFAVISDTQRWYDETERMVGDINERDSIDFVIHLGDQSDFGLTKEFVWQRKIMMRLHCPFVCIIGNHDCLGTGEDVYHEIYGEDNYSFNASFVHFVCLNTNACEYDYSQAIPDFGYIKNDIGSTVTGTLYTVAAMHAVPFSEQFNNNVADYFDYMLKQYPGLLFCLGGHDHHTSVNYLFEDSVPYYKCGNAGKKTYLIFTVTREGYKYETVSI